MSETSQNGKTSISNAIIIPKGLISRAALKFPFIIEITERVLPHEGQAIPVTLLNTQGVIPV